MRNAQPLWMITAALVACDDSSPSKQPDATTTTDATATTTTDPDTTADTSPPPDTVDPGGTLVGTLLEGFVPPSRSAPLVLCDEWYEGATVEAERAKKVRVVVPPQARPGLEQAQLTAATLVGVELARGPFAGERWHQPASTTTLVTWDLDDGATTDQLAASIAFTIAGAGTLFETHLASRSEGEDAQATSYYSWQPEGGEPTSLAPCVGGEGYEDAIAVISGTNPTAAAKTATFVRFYETQHSAFSAGSYEVRLQGWQTYLSDQSWMVFQATDQWALTYAASHHNWQDDTQVDYERDLAGWYNVFDALERDEPIYDGAVVKVQLEDVGGSSEPGSAVVTRMSAEGVTSTTTYEVAGEWKRVDRAHLERQLEGECSDGEVGAIGYGDTVAQIMWCPDAGGLAGKRLVGFVPILWALAPEQVGVPSDKITTVGDKWELDVGSSSVEIEPRQDGGFLATVFDAQGAEFTSTYTTPYELMLNSGWGGPVDAAAANVELHIERRWVAQGVGESSIYAVDWVRLEAGDDVWLVDAWDRVDYVNTHHNWNDTLAATTDDGHVIHWKIVYDFENGAGLVQTVWVTDADGTEVLAPTVVTPPAPEE